MKRLTFLIFLTLIGQLVYGQNRPIQKDELLFEKGLLLQQLVSEDLELDNIINSKDSSIVKLRQEFATNIKETILNKALEYYQEVIDSFPKSKLFFRALNNKGFIELALDEKKEAKITFQKIIDSKADDKEKGGIGSGIMAEPYANYKNRAAKILANISIEDSSYSNAIKYLDLTKKYPYRHFCGNEYAAEEIYMSELYAKSYLGLNEKQKALNILLPNILENGLTDNSYLVDLAYKTLLIDYQKDELKLKYEQAFKNYWAEKVKSKKDGYEQYFITFLDTKIELNSWQLYFLKPEERQKEIDNIYKKSKFYKLLNE
jgi:hypothetical protein